MDYAITASLHAEKLLTDEQKQTLVTAVKTIIEDNFDGAVEVEIGGYFAFHFRPLNLTGWPPS